MSFGPVLDVVLALNWV